MVRSIQNAPYQVPAASQQIQRTQRAERRSAQRDTSLGISGASSIQPSSSSAPVKLTGFNSSMCLKTPDDISPELIANRGKHIVVAPAGQILCIQGFPPEIQRMLKSKKISEVEKLNAVLYWMMGKYDATKFSVDCFFWDISNDRESVRFFPRGPEASVEFGLDCKKKNEGERVVHRDRELRQKLFTVSIRRLFSKLRSCRNFSFPAGRIVCVSDFPQGLQEKLRGNSDRSVLERMDTIMSFMTSPKHFNIYEIEAEKISLNNEGTWMFLYPYGPAGRAKINLE